MNWLTRVWRNYWNWYKRHRDNDDAYDHESRQW